MCLILVNLCYCCLSWRHDLSNLRSRCGTDQLTLMKWMVCGTSRSWRWLAHSAHSSSIVLWCHIDLTRYCPKQKHRLPLSWLMYVLRHMKQFVIWKLAKPQPRLDSLYILDRVHQYPTSPKYLNPSCSTKMSLYYYRLKWCINMTYM